MFKLSLVNWTENTMRKVTDVDKVAVRKRGLEKLTIWNPVFSKSKEKK